MASSSIKAALGYADKKFGTMQQDSAFWPRLEHGRVYAGLVDRIQKPNNIWQANTNLCGIATFFNALIAADPYFYAYYVGSMYSCGSAYLGYSKQSKIAAASKAVRTSAVPTGMAHVDWLALASLRDYFNQHLAYVYRLGTPILGAIPLFGLPFSKGFMEQLSGATQAPDLAAMLNAVGYTSVVNFVSPTAASTATLAKANGYINAGYQVFMVINPAILDSEFDGNKPAKSMAGQLHWVRLTAPAHIKPKHYTSNGEEGVSLKVYNPQGSGEWGQSVPFNYNYMRRSIFLAHYYGFVAARK